MGMVGNTPYQGIIQTGNLQDFCVTLAKIANGAVSPAKLSTGAPTWDTNGNVGLGVSSPYSLVKQDVQISADGNWAINARTYSAGTGDGTTTAKVLRAVNSANGNWAVAQYDAWSHSWTKAGTETLKIDASGNLVLTTFAARITKLGSVTSINFGTGDTINDSNSIVYAGGDSGATAFHIRMYNGSYYFPFKILNTGHAFLTGNMVVGDTLNNGPRLTVVGNSLQNYGTLSRVGEQYIYKTGGYNSQSGNSGKTLFAYAYDQSNWSYHYIKVKIKRGYYYESGFAEYMVNCQNNTVTQVSATNSGTSTSSLTLSHNTVNSNRRITTVSFVSPASYNTWDFEIEFWGMNPVAWTSTPNNSDIALN